MPPTPASGPVPGDPAQLEAIERDLTWIWGSPRSGSSWLLDLICDPARVDREDPLGFRVPGEGDRPVDVIPADEPNFGLHLAPWDSRPVEFLGKWLPGTSLNFSEERPTYALSKEHEATWRPWMRGLVLARLGAVRSAAADAGLATADASIVAKETPTGHAADRMMALLPASRALLIARDPRDVADSLMHAFRPGGFMAQQFGVAFDGDGRIDGLRWAAQMWAMSMDVGREAIDAHDASLARIVRYEDLIAEPATALADLLEWIGRPRSPDAVAAAVERNAFTRLPSDEVGELKRNRRADPGSWREGLSPEEARIVAEIAGERMERFGYAADGA